MKLYHGSRTDNIGSEVVTPDDKGVFFYGMFFSESYMAAESHGDFLVTAEVDEDDIMDSTDICWDEDAASKAIELFGGVGIDDGLLLDLIAGYKSTFDCGVEAEDIRNLNNKIADVTGCEGIRGEDEDFYLDWGLQSAACFVAHQLGYKGVAVEDEHGISYMLVPGEKFERID